MKWRVFGRAGFEGFAIATALIAGACADFDEEPAVNRTADRYLTMTRPAAVPLHFIPTPNGWFDPDCVHAVSEHEKVLPDGRIARADGSIRRAATQCLSPRFDAQGNAIVEGSVAASDKTGEVPTVSGWFEDVDSTALGAMQFVHASWTVPSNPPSNTGQVIYFFPGLEDLPVTRILQPVLGWNHADGPSGAWSMASWNCCVSGTTFHGPHVAATQNTTVQGEISGTNCDATGTCTNWAISSFNAANQGVALNTTVTTAMTWLFGHVLEAYSIDTCNELPGSTSSTASGFVLRTAPNGTAVAPPSWTDRLWSVAPTCNRSVTHTATTATLRWNVVPPVCTPGATRSCCPFAGGCGCRGTQRCNSSGQWAACVGAVRPPGVCP